MKMTKDQLTTQDKLILLELDLHPFVNQRQLAAASGQSLGASNRSLKNLTSLGYLDSGYRLTGKAEALLAAAAPRNALILAAGYGMRTAPVGAVIPKAFLEVGGERLIERLIRQLQEAGITDISVVVGFMKESFEYLIDEFGVDLIVDPAYTGRNDLHSAALAAAVLHNTYVVPGSVWCRENPFRKNELFSWYMVSDEKDPASDVRVNRKNELIAVADDEPGDRMIGIAYLMEAEAGIARQALERLDRNRKDRVLAWETALYVQEDRKKRMIVQARTVRSADAAEINTREQLRELNSHSSRLPGTALEAIASALSVAPGGITDITLLKKGTTNRSFLFTAKGRRYIIRIPGEGTDRLIDRRREADVYRAISGHGLCDDPVYLDPETGRKIARYLENARVCDVRREEDLRRCMDLLRRFHDMELSVPHCFDLFDQIEFYEQLRGGTPSVYRDYQETKNNILSLRPYLDSVPHRWCLTHIDAVADNFLFCPDGDDEQLQLIDWEYAGMQDPLADIAMFAIYSLFERQQIDHLIDLYFRPDGICGEQTRVRIYAYVAVCGLLWSNWCEYELHRGVEFGEYALRHYRYAKEYFRLTAEKRKEIGYVQGR